MKEDQVVFDRHSSGRGLSCDPLWLWSNSVITGEVEEPQHRSKSQLVGLLKCNRHLLANINQSTVTISVTCLLIGFCFFNPLTPLQCYSLVKSFILLKKLIPTSFKLRGTFVFRRKWEAKWQNVMWLNCWKETHHRSQSDLAKTLQRIIFFYFC